MRFLKALPGAFENIPADLCKLNECGFFDVWKHTWVRMNIEQSGAHRSLIARTAFSADAGSGTRAPPRTRQSAPLEGDLRRRPFWPPPALAACTPMPGPRHVTGIMAPTWCSGTTALGRNTSRRPGAMSPTEQTPGTFGSMGVLPFGGRPVDGRTAPGRAPYSSATRRLGAASSASLKQAPGPSVPDGREVYRLSSASTGRTTTTLCCTSPTSTSPTATARSGGRHAAGPTRMKGPFGLGTGAVTTASAWHASLRQTTRPHRATLPSVPPPRAKTRLHRRSNKGG